MKWSVSLAVMVVLVIVLSACETASLESKPAPGSQSDLPEKRDIPVSFFTGSQLVPVSTASPITEITGWFDDETIMYVIEHDEMSMLLQHHLYTGKTTGFFETDGWIVNVKANHDYSLFAIKVIDKSDDASLIIVDKNGEEQMKINRFGDDYSIYWSPYELDQFMMIAYLPDWEFDAFFVDVGEKESTQVELEQSYVQWHSNKEVAYLKWEQFEPTFEAPLYKIDIETGAEEKWLDRIVAYMNLTADLSLTVTVESKYELNSQYTFYEKDEPIRTMDMPILNTYSEQWWIPFYTYDPDHHFFYYLRPKYSGDFFSYDDGYEFIAYNVLANSEEILTTLESHEPIMISPGGKFILVGNRFEHVFDLKERTLVDICNS
ncbi:hypothetical protein GN156_08140 [bacterium LRH843]|nr:hypothetical protein [bacterium LRH843]